MSKKYQTLETAGKAITVIGIAIAIISAIAFVAVMSGEKYTLAVAFGAIVPSFSGGLMIVAGGAACVVLGAMARNLEKITQHQETLSKAMEDAQVIDPIEQNEAKKREQEIHESITRNIPVLLNALVDQKS